MMTSDVPLGSETSSSAMHPASPSTPSLFQAQTTLSQPTAPVVTNSFAPMQLATDPVMEAKARNRSAHLNGEATTTTTTPYSTPMSEEDAKLENAATLIQSVYRGYQTRRELFGPALTASQKWRHLIDYSRIEYIHKMDAVAHSQNSSPTEPSSIKSLKDQLSKDTTTRDTDTADETTTTIINAEAPNLQDPTSSPIAESRTRWAWRRAEFLGSRLGKGSNGISTEEALVLLTEHWLEMSDRKHRYGSNLKPYHEHWLKEDTSENFFYWLDHGKGRNLSLESRPRARLEDQRVTYLQEHERAQYAVEVIDGLLYYRQSGRLVHTLPTSIQANDDVDISQILPDADDNDDEETRLEKKRIRNKAKYIYVTDPQGILYVAQKVKGQFHHSSFLGGGTVCAAGGIIVNHGRLIKINPKSGHYRPGQRHFDKLLDNLKNMGISLEGVKISCGILETGPNGDGVERQGSIDRLVAPLEKNTETAVC
ncbi:hypothetical protein BG006_001275 [Podila minutissima]|uniref:Iq calmodulin-binding motif protein n=1 Tax=Podila minutissima TaxID=64525 RepID=A0A9P5SAC4_9FUNG|nr:hypothetical protein BG006_001275 [Podila minutissima]